VGVDRRPVVIVHLAERLVSRWMLEELLEAWRFAGERGLGFLVAGVSDALAAARLSSAGLPWVWGAARPPQPCILLDLRAERRLEPWEAEAAGSIVVGGIMGGHPPRGRTYLVALQYPGCTGRSLGREQLSIEGAVKVAALLATGASWGDISYVSPLEVEVDTGMGRVVVELPFAYPVYRGRLLAPRFLKDLLARGVLWEEETVLDVE
jgi:ribosome biogenesis SPOUT family RNA methylase Rps3